MNKTLFYVFILPNIIYRNIRMKSVYTKIYHAVEERVKYLLITIILVHAAIDFLSNLIA